MNFEHSKVQFLKKPDKSKAGKIDKDILPLIKKINKNDNYFTTSSCAGRIVLIKETGKKQENAFLKIWHNKISLKELKNALKNIKYKKIVYIKHEPCIIHVACRTLNDAYIIMNIARYSGWKKSGIISPKKNIVEMLSTEILAAPIMNNGKIIVSEDYLKVLVKECNSKLIQTRAKIKRLEKSI